jgi:hypothetical protein
VGDDDEMPLRATMREKFEGKTVTIFMAIVTLFALFGDELR